MATISDAVSAYKAASTKLSIGSIGGGESDDVQPGQSFADLMKDIGKSAVTGGKNAEKLSMQALAGKADLADVVTAVGAAETTLQTVVAVRDKVITAYQDIMRMPV